MFSRQTIATGTAFLGLLLLAGGAFGQKPPATTTYQGESEGYTLTIVTATGKNGNPHVVSALLSGGGKKYDISFGVLGVFMFDTKHKKKYEFALYETGRLASPVVAGHGDFSPAFEIDTISASMTLGKKKLKIDAVKQGGR